jgi:hypothetical protein
MDDQAYTELQIAAAVAPQSARWPKPDCSKVSISKDRVHAEPGELHWGLLQRSG